MNTLGTEVGSKGQAGRQLCKLQWTSPSMQPQQQQLLIGLTAGDLDAAAARAQRQLPGSGCKSAASACCTVYWQLMPSAAVSMACSLQLVCSSIAAALQHSWPSAVLHLPAARASYGTSCQGQLCGIRSCWGSRASWAGKGC
jgi:hypothetical protein